MKFEFILSNQEAQVLYKALAIYTSDIRNEIARTDDLNFRAGLQDEYNSLKSIEDRLEGYVGHDSESMEEKKAG